MKLRDPHEEGKQVDNLQVFMDMTIVLLYCMACFKHIPGHPPFSDVCDYVMSLVSQTWFCLDKKVSLSGIGLSASEGSQIIVLACSVVGKTSAQPFVWPNG